MYHCRPRVTAGRVAVHTLLTAFTGGGWLVVLGIRYLLANS